MDRRRTLRDRYSLILLGVVLHRSAEIRIVADHFHGDLVQPRVGKLLRDLSLARGPPGTAEPGGGGEATGAAGAALAGDEAADGGSGAPSDTGGEAAPGALANSGASVGLKLASFELNPDSSVSFVAGSLVKIIG